jgi:fucose 4-O-acetylase-like acetyltransferase
MERVIWIDGVKGFSIICVMMCHSCGFPFGTTPYFLSGFVSVFFVVSGFTLKEMTLANGLKKKGKSLLVPYFFYGIFDIIALSILFFYKFNFDLNYILEKMQGLLYSRFCLYNSLYPELYYSPRNIFFLKYGLEPLWFLTCMYLAYIWTYLYLASRRFWAITIVLYLLLSFSGSYLPILLPWSLDSSFMASFFIICGYKSKQFFFPKLLFWDTKFNYNRWVVLALFGAIFIILATVFGQGNFSLSDYGRYGILGFMSFCFFGLIKTFLLAVLMGSKFEHSFVVKALAYIGRQSLRLMCIHIVVFVYLDTVSSGNYILSFVGMFISLLISVVFDCISRKYRYSPIFKYV